MVKQLKNFENQYALWEFILNLKAYFVMKKASLNFI